MKTIEELDANLRICAEIPADDVFYDPQEPPFSVFGLVPNEEKRYCRLPLSFLPQCSEGVRSLSMHLAGACVRFSTDSPHLSVLWELTTSGNMAHFTPCGQSGLELFEESDAGIRQVVNFLPAMADGQGCRSLQAACKPLPEGLRHYALYLPLYNGLKQLRLGFAPSAAVMAGRAPRLEKPIVFYGSSITQGGCAAKVGSCYPAILARRLDAAHINLGFSGNAKGETSMARYIASLSMSAFVLDYDHNAPSTAHLAATHEAFFHIIREAQPQLPILLLTRPDVDRNLLDSRARRDIILQTYANARVKGDRHVYFLDGEHLFGRSDRELCTVDGSHPTDLGFLRMADCIEPVLRCALSEATC